LFTVLSIDRSVTFGSATFGSVWCVRFEVVKRCGSKLCVLYDMIYRWLGRILRFGVDAFWAGKEVRGGEGKLGRLWRVGGRDSE
jgi:hypothetical protein